MWLSGRGVVNHPSDGSPRAVANHLAIRAIGAGPSPFCVAPPEPEPGDPPVDAAVVDSPAAGDPVAEPPPAGCAAGGGGIGSALVIVAAVLRRARRRAR